MAYPVIDALNVPLSSALAGSATVSLSSLGLTVANDDYILIALQCSATSGTLSETSGGATTWDTTVKLNVVSGARMWLTWGKVSGGVISNPTFSLSAGTGLWQATVMHWRDADATTFSAGSVTTDHGGANNGTTGAMTPGSADSAVVYFLANRDTSAVSMRLPPAVAINQKWQQSADDAATVTLHTGIGTVQQGAAAATAQQFFCNASARLGSIVLAIKNASGGALMPDSRVASTKVAWLGDFGTTQEALGTVWGAPSTFCAGLGGALSGITLDTNAPTVNNAVTGIYSAWTSLASAINSTVWVGGWYALPATVDMSGKLISVEWLMQTFGSVLGASGVVLALGDDTAASTGNGVFFQLAPKNLIAANTPYTSVIDPANGTALQATGSINLATVKKIGLFYHRIAAGTSSRAVQMRNLFMHAASTIIGGGATRPLDAGFMNKALNGWGLVGVCNQLGNATMLKTPVQIGDGTKATYFDSSATLLNTPTAYSTINQPLFNAPADSILVDVLAAATDTVKFSASTVSMPLEQKVEINASSSTSATYSFSGESFVGAKFTDNAGVAVSNALFSGGPTATFRASLTAITVQKTTAGSAQAAMSMAASGKTITGSTIDVTGTSAGYHLELGTGVTAITLADVTFSGTAGTNKVHVLKTSGTVTITISGTTSLSAGEVTSAGATVVLSAPTPTLSATVLAGSRVVLYNETTATELDNMAPAGTAWSKAITSGASAGDTLTLYVFKEGYEEFSTAFLYSGDDTTLLVSQEVHPYIDTLRTLLGISDYTTITEFTLDVTGAVEVDADDADGQTQKARLAIWYNGVLTTENGARYLRGAISVLSTNAIRINVDVLNLKIENVSVTRGLQFTDTDRRLWRSDGTPIYAAASAPGSIENDYSGVPDTVETGVSGLTGSESAQLMALPSATDTATAVWSATLPL